MKVIHLSAMDVNGGAARAAYRLHRGLLIAGVKSQMVVGEKTAVDAEITPVRHRRKYWGLERRYRVGMHRLAQLNSGWVTGRGPERFTLPQSPFSRELLDAVGRPDIINLHWMAEFVGIREHLKQLADIAPIVWTLHDMNSFTGGCHYGEGCSRYEIGCGRCPQLLSNQDNDASSRGWRIKQNVYDTIPSERLTIVSPSKWLGATAAAAPLTKRFKSIVIPYGLDTDTFTPRDKTAARTTLGLSPDALILLFVADNPNVHRKGLNLLVEAFKYMKQFPGLLLASIGGSAPTIDSPIPHIYLGSLSNDRFLAAAYSAANLFVIPSREDNLPNTVLEAMACGVGVVGFNIGGIPDMVRPSNGRVVGKLDAELLAAALSEVCGDREKLTRMGHESRSIAVNEYALNIQAEHYVKLYSEILAGIGGKRCE